MECPQLQDFIICPREICQSCQLPSGPKFELSNLRDMYAIIRENTALPESDREVSEANIAYAQHEGELLDEEIIRGQRSLEALQKRRNALRRFEQQERALISPIRKLPVELLCRIFLLATPCIYVYPSGDHEAFPVVAAQVCSRWRTISHSYKPLWTSFDFRGSETTTRHHPKYEKLIDACVRFSNGTPLSFYLGKGITTGVLGTTCVYALARSSHHWGSVSIKDGGLVYVIFAAIPKDSILEHLEVLELSNLTCSMTIGRAPRLSYLSHHGKRKYHSILRLTIEGTPSLIHLETRWLSSSAFIGLDWLRIATFELSHVKDTFTESTFTATLECMRNLVNLILDHWIKTTRPITLPCLQTLLVRRPEPIRTDMNMFDTLSAPLLETLDVNWYDSSVIQFIRRSNMLNEICVPTINDVTCAAPEFERIKILRWMDPSQTHMRDGLNRLAFNSPVSQNDVFIGVESLHIEDVGVPTKGVSYGWTMKELVDMLKSRLQPANSEGSSRSYLKSIDISFVDDVEDEDAEVLEDFIDSELVRNLGVRVNIAFGELLYLRTSE